jgi:hypothetical protein
MAVTNQNKPTGLTPVKYLNGADWDGRGNIYFINSADTNVYAQGDLVSPTAGLDQWSGLPTVHLTVSGTDTIVAGVVLGVGASLSTTSSYRGGPYIDATNLNLIQAPAVKTKNYFVLVADDPQIVYEIQETGVGTTPATALNYTNATKNAYFVYGAPGAGAAFSGTTLDNGVSSGHVPAVTAASPYFLRMLGLSQKLDPQLALYNSFGLYAKWLVKLNNHMFGPSVVGF